MNTGSVADRLELRELIETFAVAAMRVDSARWGSTWAEDGVWKLVSMPEPVKGRHNIVEAFTKVMGYVDFMSMICFPDNLVVEGDKASGKAYCRALIFTKTGEQRLIVGCYDDHYVKRDGRWQFASRFYEVIGRH